MNIISLMETTTKTCLCFDQHVFLSQPLVHLIVRTRTTQNQHQYEEMDGISCDQLLLRLKKAADFFQIEHNNQFDENCCF